MKNTSQSRNKYFIGLLVTLLLTPHFAMAQVKPETNPKPEKHSVENYQKRIQAIQKEIKKLQEKGNLISKNEKIKLSNLEVEIYNLKVENENAQIEAMKDARSQLEKELQDFDKNGGN